ncbi:thioredoxin domain-containing protein [soil metagenome]
MAAVALGLALLLSACSGVSNTGASGVENQLANEKSSYLLEHSKDPVNWYPWSDRAFAAAKLQNKPVFLSIGYSACHWCHVMQKESFQNQAIAKILNSGFVCIKVDREERPDLDQIYMRVTEAINGSGGWPMTVLLTPDKKPFFAGTYFPPKVLQSMLLRTLQIWRSDRQNIDKTAAQNALAIESSYANGATSTVIDNAILRNAVEKIFVQSDKVYGGIGDGLKFPMAGVLSFCMSESVADNSLDPERRAKCRQIFTNTLNGMANGGIHDHVGGGFSRYSVDRQWHIPHFEKMLYDNALLAQAFLDGYLITKNQYWAATAKGVLDFVLHDLISPEGAFYSSLNADSAGEEGSYYVFTYAELEDCLGDGDGQWLARVFNVTKSGNFQDQKNVLYFAETPDALAAQNNLSIEAFNQKLRPLLLKLARARQKRIPPSLDKKLVTSWNALMISSLVKGYKVLGDENYLSAAKRAAKVLLEKTVTEHRLQHIAGAGIPVNSAYLDDYSFMVQALLDLASVDASPIWLNEAKSLNDFMSTYYCDKSTGGYFYTADDLPKTIARPRSDSDTATPSGSAVAVLNLVKLSALTDDSSYFELSTSALKNLMALMQQEPAANAYALTALQAYLHPSSQIHLTLCPGALPTAMRKAIFTTYLPYTVLVPKACASNAGGENKHASKSSDGAVYFCANTVCEKPMTSILELERRLSKLRQVGY